VAALGKAARCLADGLKELYRDVISITTSAHVTSELEPADSRAVAITRCAGTG